MEEKRLEQQRMQLEKHRLQREQQWKEQRRQREFEERKWKEERAYKDSTAVKIKTWGDALRNTMTKMPSNLSVLTNCLSSFQFRLIYKISTLSF